MLIKKIQETYQNVCQKVQVEYTILPIQELLERANRLKKVDGEIISAGAIITNQFDREVKISPNFLNTYKVKPENFNKCSLQINPKEYDAIQGQIISLDEYLASIGKIPISDAKNNPILNILTNENTLQEFLNMYRAFHKDTINLDLELPKVSSYIFSAMPIGLNQEGLVRGMCKKPQDEKTYIARLK